MALDSKPRDPKVPLTINHERRFPPRVLELVRRQHGVIARIQLAELGFTADTIDGLADSGILLRLFRGVFAVGHDVLGPKGKWYAGVLAGGPSAALSHRSAAALFEVLSDSGEVHVVRTSSPDRQPDVPRGLRNRRVMKLRIHRTRCLLPGDFTVHAGLPVTSFARMMLDLASAHSTRRLEEALTAGERRGVVNRAALAEAAARGPGWRGVGKLRKVVEQWEPGSVLTKSGLELLFLRLAADYGLPTPERNVEIGEIEVDCLWRKQKLVVEVDAFSTHGDAFSFERDRNRDAYLKAGGFDVIRLSDRMLTSGADRSMRLIHDLLRSRPSPTSKTGSG